MKKLIYIILIVTLFSCESNFILDTEYSKKIVVDGILSENDSVEINLFTNLSINDSILNATDYYFQNGLDNATVLLYENQILIDTLRQGKYPCQYLSDKIIKEECTYEIKIKHELYDSAYAITQIPTKTLIDTVSYIEKLNNTYLKLNIEFSDDVIEENFYSIRLYSLNNGYKKARRFFNIDPVFGDIFETDNSILGLPEDAEDILRMDISDEYHNGEKLNIQILLQTKYEEALAVNDIDKGDTILAILYSVNKDIALYNESLKTYQQTQSSGAQPTSLYTNIENGVGLFGGYSFSSFSFVLN